MVRCVTSYAPYVHYQTAPVGWVTCYPPMALTSDDGPVRNGLRTLRSLVTHQPCFYQKPSPHDYAHPRLPRKLTVCWSTGYLELNSTMSTWMCDAKRLFYSLWWRIAAMAIAKRTKGGVSISSEGFKPRIPARCPLSCCNR